LSEKLYIRVVENNPEKYVTNIKKNMPELTRFDEINESFTLPEAIAEAQRCLECKAPLCKQGCPIENEIPTWIHELKKGNLGNAIAVIRQKSNLPAICGRVCAHEKQCEGSCVLGKQKKAIKIGKLERFVADFDAEARLTHDAIPERVRGRVAVIGTGPSGLTVAGDLIHMGFAVDIFESEPHCGGVLRYGIPEYRLPKEVVAREVHHIEAMGVTIHRSCHIGIDKSIDELFEDGFDAVFLGTGLTRPNMLDIEGKDCKGVLWAMTFLMKCELFNEGLAQEKEINVDKGQKVFVIGGGNTAIDAARMAVRRGAEVEVLYRKTQEQMPALKSEYEDSVAEGVRFRWCTNLKAVHSDDEGEMTDILIETQDENVGTTTMTLSADRVIMAIGSSPSTRLIRKSNGIESDDRGYVVTRDFPYGMTTRQGVFAGGDVANRQATVVHAMRDAKMVAEGIAKYVDAVKLMKSI